MFSISTNAVAQAAIADFVKHGGYELHLRRLRAACWRSATRCCAPSRATSVFKQWAGIFNNDAVLTSAQLDRLLHHAETVLIEGKSYRANAQVEV